MGDLTIFFTIKNLINLKNTDGFGHERDIVEATLKKELENKEHPHFYEVNSLFAMISPEHSMDVYARMRPLLHRNAEIFLKACEEKVAG